MTPYTVIAPTRRLALPDVPALWRFRELLYFLVWRDIKVRYKQTALGAAWVIIQPFLTMVVFTVFFGRLANVPSDGVPYPVFSLAALVPWTYFATAASNGSTSLVGNQHLVAKVYFPRVLVPLAAVLMPAVDLAMAFGMGRTGRRYACEDEGIAPDFIALAKGLSAGYLPLGALLVADKVHKAIEAGSNTVM